MVVSWYKNRQPGGLGVGGLGDEPQVRAARASQDPPGPGFQEMRVYTCEPRFGGTQPSALGVLKSGPVTSVSGF